MNKQSKPSIIGTGLISRDLVASTSAQPAWRSFAGGTCGNVLAILSYLGWAAYPVARLNGDNASKAIREDLERWGVRLDYASLHPTAHTPIIVQSNRQLEDGEVTHHFSWRCPSCKQYLPGFSPIRRDSVAQLVRQPLRSDVFFFDRVSSGILLLAQAARTAGAVIFFEPSAKTSEKQMADALSVADIVKYSDQRYPDRLNALGQSDTVKLEIQTRGKEGFLFRSCVSRSTRWRRFPPTVVGRIKDTAGAGDWFSATLIDELLRDGRGVPSALTDSALECAFKVAAAAAAWSCQFEGARGGMYLTTKRSYRRQIKRIQEGKHFFPQQQQVGKGALVMPDCPACP